MNCCDAYGKCTQGPDCPVRETRSERDANLSLQPMDNGWTVGEHFADLPITMEDEPIRLRDLACDCVWWIGTAALAILVMAALGLATGLVQRFI